MQPWRAPHRAEKRRQAGGLPTLSYGGITRVRFEGTLSPGLPAQDPHVDARKVLQCGGCFNAGSASRIADLERFGFSIAIFPGGTARAAAFAFAEYFASRKAHGTTASHRGRMIDFDELQRLLGTADMLAPGKRYDDPGA